MKINQTKFGGPDKQEILDLKFNPLVDRIFKDVGSVLLEIYKVYFPHEIKGNYDKTPTDPWNKSEKCLFDFLR